MTTAGRVKVVEGGRGLWDVPLPDQSGRDYCQPGEGGGVKAWGESGGVLIEGQFPPTLVGGVVGVVHEAPQENFDRQDVNQADAERRSRAADQGAERQTDGAVDREDQPDGA